MAISLFYAYLSAIFVTREAVKVKQMPKFYTSAILLTNQSKGICEKQFSVFGSKGGQISPFNARTPFVH